MKAYAILSGGGAKGAALAGCVNAASRVGVEFVGYGGTSAGSIVALLASIGYTNDSLRQLVVDEMPFNTLLDDDGVRLDEARKQVDFLLQERPWWDLPKSIRKLWILWSLGRIGKELGVYEGSRLGTFLDSKIRTKLPALSSLPEISFGHLKRNGGKLLKIVATDLTKREPAIFCEKSDDLGSSVIRAVRASTAYPFVFRPVVIGNHWFVDGGLASNVPVFLFRHEYQETRYPSLAFDVGVADELPNGYDLNRFSRDLLAAALEASDAALRQSLPGIKYIKVPLENQFDALDFKVDREQRESLYLKGFETTTEALKDYPPLNLSRRAHDLKKQLQSLYGPPSLYEPILASAAGECEEVSGTDDVRASIIMPTMHQDGSQMVVYDYNMERDLDRSLILAKESGCAAHVMQSTTEDILLADLEELRLNPEVWGLTEDEASHIPGNRKTMMSVAIISWRDVTELNDPEYLRKGHRIGVLSVDTTTSLTASRWKEDPIARELAERLRYWARIIAGLLHRYS